MRSHPARPALHASPDSSTSADILHDFGIVIRPVNDRAMPTEVALAGDGGGSRLSLRTSLSIVGWQLVRDGSTNVLIVGDAQATDPLATALGMASPLVCNWTPDREWPPSEATNTIFIRDVCTLSPRWQRRWEAWLHEPTSHHRVVTASPVSLLPLVDRGYFRTGLYYRLNTVLLKVQR